MMKEASMNFYEKDIEDWLYEHPVHVPIFSDMRVESWIGRQYRLPSGIADLIAYTTTGHVAVIEVKSVPVDARAITQVCRYAADVQSIIQHRGYYRWSDYYTGTQVLKVVIAPGVESDTILLEADACNVALHKFSATLDIRFGEFKPRNYIEDAGEWFDAMNTASEHVAAMAAGSEWDVIGPNISYSDLSLFERVKEEATAFAHEMRREVGDTEHF